MKTQLKAVRVLLYLLIAVLIFSACRKQNGGNTNTAPVEPPTEEPPNDDLDENGYLKDDLPELDFRSDDGKLTPITVLSWKPELIEINVDSTSGDVIPDTIYKRNQRVEERLGIYISVTERSGNVSNASKFVQFVNQQWQNGDHFDIVAAHTRTESMCASRGLLKDLNDISGSYIDLDKPWWSDDLTKNATISNRLFFATGDISANLLQMIYCVYFNADALGSLTDNDPDKSPYAMVANNTWTLANMIELTKDYYIDVNDNREIDLNDKLAVIGEYYAWPALLHGCNIPIASRDINTGALMLNSDFKGEKAQRVMDNILLPWIQDTANGGGLVTFDTQRKDDDAFLSGNVLFYLVENGRALTALKGSANFEYGCVPAPKYDSDQDTYYSTVRQTVTLYGIMSNVPGDELQMVTAAVECLASTSYRMASPVIFGEQIQYNASASSQMRQMQQLIKDTAFFDLARIFAAETSYVCDKPGRILAEGSSWSGQSGYLINVEQLLQQLNNNLTVLS